MKNYIFLVVMFFLVTACAPAAQTDPVTYVDLNNLQSLPEPEIQDAAPLRVAVAAVISPQGTVESYSDLLDYLSEKTGRPVELVQRRTYMEVNDLIERGEVDVAFVCTSAYIAGKDDFDMQLLVAPQVNGETIYRSILIVPSDSAAQGMADLKGKVFAFTDPISLTGRAYPTSLVQQLGSTPEEFFASTFFTYSHDEAIYAVANHLADGANVDSLVYEFAVSRDPSISEKTKVIHSSQPFGIPPVVVNPLIRPQVRDALKSLLLEMTNDPQGKIALKSIGADQFVYIDDSAYDGVRELLGEVTLPETP
jgi:phosphonate transport system substrate-binding protein